MQLLKGRRIAYRWHGWGPAGRRCHKQSDLWSSSAGTRSNGSTLRTKPIASWPLASRMPPQLLILQPLQSLETTMDTT